MRILIINYRYFVSGGPERYLFNLKSLLESKGHVVIPFSINYSKNVPSEYSKYFVTPLSGFDEIYFKDQKLTLKSIYKTLERSFYSYEVFNKMSLLINEQKPDFAIVLHYLKKLSPSVLSALHKSKIPFVVRLSDFLMICPNAHLFRDNQICELCIKGSLINSVKYSCVQNSKAATIVHYFATKYHNFKKYFNLIKYFIVPSKFTMEKMIEAGYEQNRFIHIPTFVYLNSTPGEKENIISYVGRIGYIKGVHILIKALSLISDRLKDFRIIIMGNGNKDYMQTLIEMKENYNLTNLEFTGHLAKDEILGILKKSLFSVSPQLWYENIPNSVLESFSVGTTVIGSELGSLKELINDGKTGIFFKSGDFKDLSNKMLYLINNKDIAIKLGYNAYNYVGEFHNPEVHYNKLMEVYYRLVNTNKSI
ncbi:MAG: putative glycosyltransferase protein [Ignavibacteriae bacterium]|nr:MAG: putative glycosyltransferase protein [Ignavibacteriota bacterium]